MIPELRSRLTTILTEDFIFLMAVCLKMQHKLAAWKKPRDFINKLSKNPV